MSEDDTSSNKASFEAKYSIRSSLGLYMDRLEILYNNGMVASDLRTGFSNLDAKLMDLRVGTVVAVGGIAATGKTAFMLDMATHVAVRMKRPVLYFSMQHSASVLVERLTGSEGRIPTERSQTGKLLEVDWSKVGNAVSRLAESSLFIDESPSLSIDDIWFRSKWMKDLYGSGLIVVDHAQLMKRTGTHTDARSNTALLEENLRELARELEMVVVVASQLRSTTTKGMERRPQLIDFDEYPSLVNSDVIIALYRDALKNREPGCPASVKVSILKQPNNRQATVFFEWTWSGSGLTPRFTGKLPAERSKPVSLSLFACESQKPG